VPNLHRWGRYGNTRTNESADRARHTTITLLAQAGVSRGIIATIVGHDDPAFTERVYTHIDLDAARQGLALESIFPR